MVANGNSRDYLEGRDFPSPTAEQRDADALLERAIQEVVRAYGLLNGCMLVDFMCIIEGLNPEDDEAEEFGMAFRGGRTRTVVALGLVEKASELLSMSGVRLDDD